MNHDRVTLADAGRARGTAVVIDVLRAFTTEAVALHRGARSIRLVADVDEARRLGAADPDLVLVGEQDGHRLEGFHHGNSPTELERADLAGRRLVHRTTAGTRGAVAAAEADALVGGTFLTAEATVRWLLDRDPATLTMVVTGAHSGRDGDEDAALADYLLARIAGRHPDPAPYLARVRASDAAARFGTHPDLPAADVDAACRLDRFDRVLHIDRADGSLVVTW